MKVLYIECPMGAAGDMLTAALLELVPDADAVVKKLNNLGIPGVRYEREESVKCGIKGTHMRVSAYGEEEKSEEWNGSSHRYEDVSEGAYQEHLEAHIHIHEHHHATMEQILSIIDSLSLSEQVKKDAQSVYVRIAEAESAVHGVPVSEIHFHEVGTMDAIADVVAVSLLMEELAVDQVIVSPVNVGSGQVHCAHGILPVPAPATAHILSGVPVYSNDVKGELTTPTGAAILAHFADAFGAMPKMRVDRIGYGMGAKDFPVANCVCVFLGELDECANHALQDRILELRTNIDDMTAEELGLSMEKILEAGAVDVAMLPVTMKKNRPGTMLCVLCKEEKKDEVVRSMFKHTTTIGIREVRCERYLLDRTEGVVSTEYGEIRYKHAEGYGVSREKYEYDDLARIADARGLSIREVRALADAARENHV